MKNRNFLKPARPLFIAILFITFGLASCSSDDNDTAESTQITEEEAVDVIATSMAKDSNGMSKTMQTSVEMAESEDMFVEEENVACGQTNTEAYSQSNVNGNYSYNYTLNTNYTLSCTNAGFPDYFTYDAALSGVYDTPRMSSDDTSQLSWTVTGLPPSNSSVTFNGDYERNGTQISKVRNMNTFSSTLTYNVQDIVVSKSTYQILSGTASVTFIGISSTGNQYTFSGTITFNGDETATLLINGNSYTINL